MLLHQAPYDQNRCVFMISPSLFRQKKIAPILFGLIEILLFIIFWEVLG